MNNSTHTIGTNLLHLTGLITGLLTGGLTGFFIVSLIAPYAGTITRRKIGQKSALIRNRAMDTYSELLLLSQFDKRQILSGTRKDDSDL